jgi:hypothetical protein
MTNTTDQEKLLITKYDLLFESRLSKTEEALKHIDSTLSGLRNTVDRLDRTMQDGFRELRGDYKWLLGLMLTTTGATLLIMAHGFHWIP